MASTNNINPRKVARQARSQATVSALLRATARILVKQGYDHASTNKIAKLAGVSVGSLYQYFPSKEAIVAALVDEHIQDMSRLMQDALPTMLTLSLEECVRKAVHLMVAAHAIDPALHRVLVEQVPRLRGLKHMEALEGQYEQLARALLESKRAELIVEDLELAALIVVNIVESLTHMAVLRRPDLLNAEFEEQVALAVLRYLRGADRPACAPARSATGSARSRAGVLG